MQEQELISAYTPSPGEILATELATRGWSQRRFATIIGRPPQAVNEILRAKKQITSETALRIAAALNTSPELWINLETDYRLSLARRTVSRQILTEIAHRSEQSQVELA